jgi:branched-chain amino acid transport system permease protein
MSFIFAQALTGLAGAASLFLIAAGLSLIFGVTRIVNFAHGSFTMLGAYMAVSLSGALMPLAGPIGFWLAVPLAALGAGTLGAVMEIAILRHLYRSNELYPLLATFAVLLILQDAALALWGPEDLLGPLAPGLTGAVTVFGARVPSYDLFLIAMGPITLSMLLMLLHRTRWGLLLRAAAQDREMAGALGVDQRRLFTAVVFLGTALAGLGGALQMPREAANLGMDLNVIVEAFVVVVIGGMGSLTGAFLAAILIGVLSAFGIVLFPQITLVLLFLVMAVVLVLRPQGLLGRAPNPGDTAPPGDIVPLAPPGQRQAAAAMILILALALLPVLGGGYALSIAGEVLILALFAASLQVLMGIGGMISFGHAAAFGLGAYGAALAVMHFAAPMALAVFAGPLAAGLGGLVFGWFCVRLSGVYLAMLTLAFAQILWSAAFQWVALTGGDNGILGVWPSAWAADPIVFYLLILGVVGAAILALRRIVFSPFGYALRACRDSSLRAEAIGIDTRHRRWMGFALAAGFAGLAGALYAFLKGNVFPDVLAISTSVDALVMVLLGGVQSLSGPLAGAAVFTILKAELLAMTDLWRAVVGAIVLLLVLAFPHGLAGAAKLVRRA